MDRGGNIRLWSLCRSLVDRYDFELVSLIDSGFAADKTAVEALRLALSSVFRDAHLVPIDSSSFKKLWTQFYMGRVQQLYSPLGERIQAVLRRGSFSLVHFEHVQLLPCRQYVFNVPAVFTDHDIGWFWPFRSVTPVGPWWKWSGWARKLAFHRKASRAFQGVVVVGEGDLRWWRCWGPSGISVAKVPTGVDPERFLFRAREGASAWRELSFIGNFAHPPNVDAALYFLSEIWPSIHAADSRARVTFVGPHPPPELLARAGARVLVTGAVDDVRPFLRRARVFVAPHRRGGGIKGKLLEAFATGVPVVATGVAVEGFTPSGRTKAIVANSPKAFARAAVNLLKDTSARRDRAILAREWVEREGTWDKSAALLDRFYWSVLKTHRL